MGNNKKGNAKAGVSRHSHVSAAKGAIVHARSERERVYIEHKRRDLRSVALKLRAVSGAGGVDTDLDELFSELRRLAFSSHGFVSDELRQLIWPLLLGEGGFHPVRKTDESHFTKTNAPHRDDQQIEKDIDRSMWHHDVVIGIRETERRVKRKQLTQVINAVLNDNAELYYYQGYHDVCSVFLLVLGDQHAFRAVRAVSNTYHREPMRKNFEIVLHATRLLYPLLQAEDPKLFAHIQASGVEPFFAMPWLITWFAHQLTRFADVTRIYDVMLVSHPLFAVYLSAAVVLDARQRVLRAECDFGSLHGVLAKLPQTMDIERVILQSNLIFHRNPPRSLLSHSEQAGELSASQFFAFPFEFHARFRSIDQPSLPPSMYKKNALPLIASPKSSAWKSNMVVKAAVVGLVAVALSFAFRHHLREWVPLFADEKV